MKYRVFLHPKAHEFLEKVDETLAVRIKKKLTVLREDPGSGKSMTPSNFRSLRIGDYRAVYEVDYDGERVLVLFIGHRKTVYGDFSRLL